MKKIILLISIIFFSACTESKSPNTQFTDLDKQLENSKTTNKNSLSLEATIKVIFTLDEAIKNVVDRPADEGAVRHELAVDAVQDRLEVVSLARVLVRGGVAGGEGESRRRLECRS